MGRLGGVALVAVLFLAACTSGAVDRKSGNAAGVELPPAFDRDETPYSMLAVAEGKLAGFGGVTPAKPPLSDPGLPLRRRTGGQLVDFESGDVQEVQVPSIDGVPLDIVSGVGTAAGISSVGSMSSNGDGVVALVITYGDDRPPTRLVAVLRDRRWSLLEPATATTKQLCARKGAAFWLDSAPIGGGETERSDFTVHRTDLTSDAIRLLPVPAVNPDFGGATVVLGCDADSAYLTSGRPEGEVEIYRYVGDSWSEARELLPEQGTIATTVLSSPVGLAVIWADTPPGKGRGITTGLVRESATGRVATMPAGVARAPSLLWDESARQLVAVGAARARRSRLGADAPWPLDQCGT